MTDTIPALSFDRPQLLDLVAKSGLPPAMRALATLAIARAPEDELETLRGELRAIVADLNAGTVPDIARSLERLNVPAEFRPMIATYAKRLFHRGE